MTEPVYIGCEEPGCQNGIGVYYRHVDNFLGRFHCPEHNQPSSTLPERNHR